jgi:hypothetical protein
MHAARSVEMVQLLLDQKADHGFYDHLDHQPLYCYAVRDAGRGHAGGSAAVHGVEVNSIASMPWEICRSMKLRAKRKIATLGKAWRRCVGTFRSICRCIFGVGGGKDQSGGIIDGRLLV